MQHVAVAWWEDSLGCSVPAKWDGLLRGVVQRVEAEE